LLAPSLKDTMLSDNDAFSNGFFAGVGAVIGALGKIIFDKISAGPPQSGELPPSEWEQRILHLVREGVREDFKVFRQVADKMQTSVVEIDKKLSVLLDRQERK